MKTVALLAGHSIKDPGAVNPNSGHTEYDYNRTLGNLIAIELAKVGVVRPLIVNRDTYKGLPSKVNATGADVAIELHCNAFNGEASGTEMLCWVNSKIGHLLADRLQNAAYKVLALPYRGVKRIGADDRGGYLLKRTEMPCVIVESFFIDNDNDLAVGLKYQHQLAKAYAQVIEDYLSE